MRLKNTLKTNRADQILLLVIVWLMVWLLNQISNRYGWQIDLTEERRYTISEATKTLLKGLDREVFIEVFLDGDLPPNFERFQKAIGEMLERFREESGNSVQFKFTDPAQASSARARNQFFRSLMEKGLQPTQLNYRKDGDRFQKIIFPSAIAAVGAHEIPINLLKGNRASGPEEMLNQSTEGLEYEMASAIAQLTDGGTKKIAYLIGHGSPQGDELAGFKNVVLNKYALYEIRLDHRNELNGYDVVIIGKPRTPFSEREKYLLDQYLMRGGNLVYFLDALKVNIDSALGDGTVAIPYETNLSDQLFKYGVRVNQNLVIDVNNGQLPVVTGNIGNQPQVQMIPWPFFPMVTSYSKHPIVRNLDAMIVRFVSSIDTVKAEGIKKIPLFSGTAHAKVLGSPVRVALNDLREMIREEYFNDGIQHFAYLLEGKFTSLYNNRLIPNGFDRTRFVSKENNGKVIVVSDGDLIVNEFDPDNGEPLALGVEAFTKNTFANQAFVLNMLDYLTDDTGLIAARSRDVKIRPLDKVKIKQERVRWQVINLVVPVMIIFLIGGVKWYLRRKRYII